MGFLTLAIIGLKRPLHGAYFISSSASGFRTTHTDGVRSLGLLTAGRMVGEAPRPVKDPSFEPGNTKTRARDRAFAALSCKANRQRNRGLRRSADMADSSS